MRKRRIGAGLLVVCVLLGGFFAHRLSAAHATTTPSTTTQPGKRVCAFISPVVLIPTGKSSYSFTGANAKEVLGGDVTYSSGLKVTGADFVSAKYPTVLINNTGKAQTGWYDLYYFC